MLRRYLALKHPLIFVGLAVVMAAIIWKLDDARVHLAIVVAVLVYLNGIIEGQNDRQEQLDTLQKKLTSLLELEKLCQDFGEASLLHKETKSFQNGACDPAGKYTGVGMRAYEAEKRLVVELEQRYGKKLEEQEMHRGHEES